MSIISLRKSDREFDIVYDIRLEVFVKEQDVPLEMELDEYDDIAIHVLVYDDNMSPVGCGRIIIEDKYATMGRIAVKKDKRGSGYGRFICNKLIEIALENKMSTISLHSQCYAISFYEKFGFVTEGEVYDEAGISHINMVKNIHY